VNPWQITRVFLSIQTLAVDDIILFSAAATACLAAARENLEEDASTMVIMKYIYTNDGFCIPLPVLVGWEVDCRCSGCTGDDTIFLELTEILEKKVCNSCFRVRKILHSTRHVRRRSRPQDGYFSSRMYI